MQKLKRSKENHQNFSFYGNPSAYNDGHPLKRKDITVWKEGGEGWYPFKGKGKQARIPYPLSL